MQADEVWHPTAEIKVGLALHVDVLCDVHSSKLLPTQIPQPKPSNPDVLLPQSRVHEPGSDNFARPCPHCTSHNQFGWRCPRPIPDPEANLSEAWNLDDGTNANHNSCNMVVHVHIPSGPPPGHGFCGAW